MIRLTVNGRWFIGVCILLYLSSIFSQSTLLLALIGILLGCFCLNFFLARRSLKNLEIIAPEQTRLAEGERLSQPWKIVNRSPKPSGFIQIHSGKRKVQRLQTLGSFKWHVSATEQDTILRLANLPPGTTASIVPNLAFAQRGIRTYAEMECSSAYPFGLLKATRRLNLPGEIIVQPAIYPTPAPHASGYDVMLGGKFHGRRRVASGTYFAGIRPMQPSDPLKQIHWKSSAKGQGLMVKTFEEELSGRVSIVLDVGHSGDGKTLDDCIRAAGSLIFSALDHGDHVELIDLASLDLLLIPPFADGDEILDRLARVEGQRDCLTANRLERAIDRVSRKSAVCFVLTDFNAAVERTLSILQNRHQRVSVYVPEKCQADAGDVAVSHFGEKQISSVLIQ